MTLHYKVSIYTVYVYCVFSYFYILFQFDIKIESLASSKNLKDYLQLFVHVIIIHLAIFLYSFQNEKYKLKCPFHLLCVCMRSLAFQIINLVELNIF